MTLTGFPFVLDPADKHRLLTLEEHEGLCCLLDRARHYGGAGDIAFLCMSTCSLLVRFAPEKTGTWTVCGYAFQKAQEPWVWAYLPSLPGTLLAPPSGKLLFHAERADTADVWLERHAAGTADWKAHFRTSSRRRFGRNSWSGYADFPYF